MPVSSGRVNRRSRLKKQLLDSPGWVTASGHLFSTPQSDVKKNNRRSTLLPGNFSPRRTRRQTIVMSVPVVNISEEMDELPEAEDAVTSEVVSAKPKLQNGSSASGDVSKEIEVELMKAPSKRAVRASAKAMKNGKSAKLPSKLPSVAEKPSESRRRGRKPKKDKKQTSKSKDKENVVDSGSEFEAPKEEGEAGDSFEFPTQELDLLGQSSSKAKKEPRMRQDVLLTGTPVLLLNRIDKIPKASKNGTPTASQSEDDDPLDEALDGSRIVDTSISSFNTSQAANTSGRCFIL